MKPFLINFLTRRFLLLLLGVSLCGLSVPAQQRQSAPPVAAPEQDDEVVRVSSELVQTDVMVFDRQGKFVEGLQPSQFELKVDGKVRPITFFEMVRAGSPNEDLQLAAARGGARPASASDAARALPLDRGRTVFFFVDDLHIAPVNLPKARQVMLRFINEQMGQNDEAAVVSASGQVGFLQQLTSEKTVLRAAIERLSPRQMMVRDIEQPQMSELHAQAIEGNDRELFEYYVNEWIKRNIFGAERESTRLAAEASVRSRATSISQQAAHVTRASLASLENFVRSTKSLSGRKVLFFISDGFFVNRRTSDVTEQLRRVTDAAARSGMVIYAIDSRGLSTGMLDASQGGSIDTQGILARYDGQEITALQEGLHTLAAETGGRAILNTNKFETEVQRVLKETEVYYILAWTPEAGTGRGSKFRRLEVSVVGRPDLSVRVRRGFFDAAPAPAVARKRDVTAVAEKKETPQAELVAAISAPYERTELPTALAAGFVEIPQTGATLTTFVQLDGSTFDYGTDANKQPAKIDLICWVLDDKGKVASAFQRQISAQPPAPNAAPMRRRFAFAEYHQLAPGLYQVRLAAREERTGRTGTRMQWIEVPDLRQGKFLLSSIFVGERTADSATDNQPTPVAVPNVDHRFARTSKLQFSLFIYNAGRAPAASAATTAPAQQGSPDVALQVQVFRDDQPVITAPLRKVETTGVEDLKRIPYAAELNLAGMPAGQYALQVTAIDRVAKANATQRLGFVIE